MRIIFVFGWLDLNVRRRQCSLSSPQCVQSKNTNTHSAAAILLVASVWERLRLHRADIEDKLQENAGSPVAALPVPANSSQSRTDAATMRQKTDLMNVPCVGRVLSLGVCCLAQTGIRPFYSCSSHSLRVRFVPFSHSGFFAPEFIALTHCQWWCCYCCCCCCRRSAHIFVRPILKECHRSPRLPHAVNSGS